MFGNEQVPRSVDTKAPRRLELGLNRRTSVAGKADCAGARDGGEDSTLIDLANTIPLADE